MTDAKVNHSEAWLKIVIANMDKVPCELEVESLVGWCVVKFATFSCGEVPISAMVRPNRKKDTMGSDTPL